MAGWRHIDGRGEQDRGVPSSLTTLRQRGGVAPSVEDTICFVETSNRRVGRLARAVVALVADASRGMTQSLDVNRVALLRLATAEPGITPTEAGRRLHLPSSSVTRHAQALEEAGHVVLRRNPQDRRSAVMQATDAGIKELAALDEVGVEIFAGVVADWSTEDIEQLATLIEKLTGAWARHGERNKHHRRRVSRWQHDTPQEDQ